jgi:hypothetical protein
MKKELTPGINFVPDSNAYLNVKAIYLLKVLNRVLYIRLRLRRLHLFFDALKSGKFCSLFILDFNLQSRERWTIFQES